MKKRTVCKIPIKIAAIVFALAVSISFLAILPSYAADTGALTFSCPDGYAERYVIKVGTKDELIKIAQDVNNGVTDYKGITIALTANINLSLGGDSYSYGFSPIGTNDHPFRGIFDGCGYTVTLQLPSNSEYGPEVKDAAGLFGYAETAVIRNVTVAGTLQSTGKTGGIAAYAISTEIINCVNKASLKGSTVGGIAAVISGTSEKSAVVGNCYNSATSFSSLTVSGYSGGFGGIVGRMEGDYSFVYNCYSSKAISDAKIGGLVGYADGKDPVKRVENSFYIANKDSARGIYGKDDLMNYVTAIDLSYTKLTETNEHSLGYLLNRYIDLKGLSDKYGKWSYKSSKYSIANVGKTEVTPIASAADWNRMADESQSKTLTGGYYLTADISSVTKMLGNTSHPFKGALLGAGHTVTVNISSNSDCAGLISYAENATVLDVTVKGTIHAANSVGAVIGKAVDTHIGRCTSAVRITGRTDVGGIIGMAKGNCWIENCVCGKASNGSEFIVGSGFVTCGGIVGLLSDNSTVEWCQNYADIKSESRYVGGIVGCMQESAVVRACCNYGSVTGKTDVGGIVGCAEVGKLIEGCYTQAVVTATENGAAGIVGKVDMYNPSWDNCNAVHVMNCVNVGLIVSADPNARYDMVPNDMNGLYQAWGKTYSKEEYTKLLYTIDLNIPAVNGLLNSGALADYFNCILKDSGIEDPTYWQKGENTAFAPTTNPRDEQKYIGMLQTEEPYVISNADDFRLFSVLIGFDGLKNTTWKLGADITLAESDRVTLPFAGTLDGDGHTLTLHSTNGALFSEVSGTIKSLKITGAVSDDDTVGALVGTLAGGTLDSCENTALVTGTSARGGTGGLVGTVMSGTIRNCTNSALITKKGIWNVGGIFGVCRGDTTVVSCENRGDILSSASGAGGIGGGITAGTLKISLCNNFGNIRADSTNLTYFGGILGYSETNAQIEYSINKGKILYQSGCKSFGGILGGVNLEGTFTVNGCGNFGDITLDPNATFGGLPSPDGREATVPSATQRVGGIVGQCGPSSGNISITFSVNDAVINGMTYVGGIVGDIGDAVITDCYNAGAARGENAWHGTISGSGTNDISKCLFTSSADTYQMGTNPIFNPWSYGLAEPNKSLEFLLNRAHRYDGSPFGWSIDANGHCTKAEWNTIGQAPDYTQDSPYIVKDAATWKVLQFYIASGLDFAGQHVRLDTDLTITSALAADGTAFRGVFEGNGKTITLGSGNDGRGVFGTLTGAAIKNLKVAGNISEGTLRGGFAQTASATSFEYCESSVRIGYSGCSGGDDCGGFVGVMTDGCLIVGGKSTATVYGGNRVGGFVGAMYGGEVRDIKSDSNQSSLTGFVSGNENVGGFAGKTTDLTVRNAALRPIVNGVRYVGGVVGDAYNCVITSCSVTTGTNNNQKWIYASVCSAGGIVGITCNSNINNCKVYALIWAQDTGAGGIAGTCYPATTIYQCTVEGGIYGYDRIGGILGDAWNTDAGGLVAIDECTVATKYPAEPGGYVAIAGRWSVGGIVGYTNAYTAVKYCANSSALWSDNANAGITPYVGGIVAYSDAPSITVMNCLNEGYLEAQNGVIGGIVAHADCAYLYNDVNAGDMRRAKYFAGIVCELEKTDKIKNCANIGEIILAYSSSPVAWSLCPWTIDCWHCAVIDHSGNAGNWFGGTYLWGDYVPYAEMALFLNNGIDEAAPDSFEWIRWEHDNNTCLRPQKFTASQLIGNGTAQSPYLLSDSEDFEQLATLLNTGAIPGNVCIRVETSFYLGANSIPLGTEQYPFKGDFDGNGKALTVSIRDRATSMNGVFGYTDGATIHDVEVLGDVSRVGSDSGMLVGIAKNTTIVNCSCGGVFSTVPDAARCGGIVGSALGSTRIEGCRTTGSINQLGNQCGGIVGYATGSVQIIDCVNTKNVALCGSDCGGIVGKTGGGVTITKCVNYGDFQSAGENCGGIVGLADGSPRVTDCRNYGAISVSKAINNVGGVVGAMHGFGRIERCVNEGTLYIYSGSGRIGGIVGICDYRDENTGSHEIQIVNCTNYGDIINSARSAHDVGGIVGYSTGTLVACVNNGDVSGDSSVGGLIGYEYFRPMSTRENNTQVLYFCINTGKISGNTGVGEFYGDCGGNQYIMPTDVVGCISADPFTYRELDKLYAEIGIDPRGCAYRVPGIDKNGLPTTVFRYGRGTAEDPYLISDIRELEMLAFQTGIGMTNGGFEGEYFRLECDFPTSECLIPIGLKTAFAGTFDGNGKTIELNTLLKKLRLTPAGEKATFNYMIGDHLALFANATGATICNLRVSGSVDGAANEIIPSASSYTAGIVGSAKSSTISDCQVDARVRGGSVVGGIAATVENSTLNNCICRSVVEGSHLVGGVVGEIIGDCSFLNCIGSAITKAADGTVGAFAGTMERAGNITWNGNFLVTGKTTVDKAIALGASPFFAYLTPAELMTRSVLTPYYRTQETGICLILFYVNDPHGRTDATYPAVEPDYVRDGSLAYFRCNSCGKYYTDPAHQHEIPDFDKWYRESCVIPKFNGNATFQLGTANGDDIDVIRFRTADEFVQYLSEHRTTEFQLIALGGDVTTSFPVIINKATVYLHGYTWMTTGVYDAAIVDRSPVVANNKYFDWLPDATDGVYYTWYNVGGGSVIYGDGGTIASNREYHSLISFSNLRICDTTLCGAVAENGAALCDSKGAAQAVEIVGCIIRDCQATGKGGAIYMNGSGENLWVHLENTEIANCSAFEGGAIYCAAKQVLTLRFISGNIHHCSAVYGGGINISAGNYIKIVGDGPSPERCRITDCQAKAMGGGIYLRSAAKAEITGIEMIGNYTSDAYGPQQSNLHYSDDDTLYCDGGALFIDAPEAIVTSVNFALNSAGHRGGAISCEYGINTLKLDSCRFYLDVIPNEPGYDIGYGYEVNLPSGRFDVKNIIVHPFDKAKNVPCLFYTENTILYSIDLSEVHINDGITGSSSFEGSSLVAVIVSASVGVAALIGVAVFVIVRKKKKASASVVAESTSDNAE